MIESFDHLLKDSSRKGWRYEALKIDERDGESLVDACHRVRDEIPFAVMFLIGLNICDSFILPVDNSINKSELSEFIKSKFPLLDLKLLSESGNLNNVKSYQKLNY